MADEARQREQRMLDLNRWANAADEARAQAASAGDRREAAVQRSLASRYRSELRTLQTEADRAERQAKGNR